MATVGFHCPHEQFSPRELLGLVKQAESAGFQAAMCSDHFHPWLPKQGQGGFAWSWLGSALEATKLSLGTVSAPGDRYHPAIIAQAAATLSEMYPGRFWLAVGSGEALNEHITANPWPQKPVRNERLNECVEIIRALWRGESVSHKGLVSVRDAQLYTLPKHPPLLLGAALTEQTAHWAGSWADGLITVAAEPDQLKKMIDAFRSGGGAGKPLYLQVALSYAATDQKAIQAAHQEWRQAGLDASSLADLQTPEEFQKASRTVTPEVVRERLRISSDLGRHLEWLAQDIELGFESIYIHNVGRNQEEFIEAFADQVLGPLRGAH